MHRPPADDEFFDVAVRSFRSGDGSDVEERQGDSRNARASSYSALSNSDGGHRLIRTVDENQVCCYGMSDIINRMLRIEKELSR